MTSQPALTFQPSVNPAATESSPPHARAAVDGRRSRRAALAVVAGTVFVDMTGFGIVLPSLPFAVAHLGGSGVWVGLVLTAYAAAQFLAAPMLGLLSDRYGRRPLLLLTLVGSAVGMGVTAVAGSLLVLLAARLLAGACGGAIAVGQAYAADLVAPERRVRALGLVGAAVGLGFVAGPAIGAGLAATGFGFRDTCLVAAGLALANTVIGLVVLPRSVRSAQPATRPAIGARMTGLVRAVRQPALGRVVVAVFGGMAAFATMETTLALLIQRRFGAGPGTLGLVLGGVGIAVALTQAVLVGRLSDRYGHRATAALGAALLGLGLLAVPLLPAWLAYGSLGAVAAGHGLLATGAAALIAGTARTELGGVLGVGQSAGAAARATAPIVAGTLYDIGPAVPYLAACASCVAAALLLSLRAGRSSSQPTG